MLPVADNFKGKHLIFILNMSQKWNAIWRTAKFLLLTNYQETQANGKMCGTYVHVKPAKEERFMTRFELGVS